MYNVYKTKNTLTMISLDHGKNWTKANVNEKYILVIQPGAGTWQNQEAYKLQTKTYKRNLIKVDVDGDNVVEIRRNGFKYPPNWRENSKLKLARNLGSYTSLQDLATKVGKKILELSEEKKCPSCVICGSRGSQVTIGLLWKHFWRGPTICINAGPLTSETNIPEYVYPVMITMSEDYFKTKYTEFVKSKFKELSQVDGKLVHIVGMHHMPGLTGKFLNQVILLATEKKEIPNNSKINRRSILVSPLIGTSHSNNKKSNRAKSKSKPSSKCYTVQNFNSKFKFTGLRRSPTEGRVFNGKVRNGTSVSITKRNHDENEHPMVYIHTEDTEQSGWIYERNVLEFQ